jgi:hypothetical protein
MHAIGFAEQGEVDIVIDDQLRAIFAGQAAQRDGLFLTVAVGCLLVAVLQNAAAGIEDGFGCIQQSTCVVPVRRDGI